MEPSLMEIVLRRLDSIDKKLDGVVTWASLKYIGAALLGAVAIVEFILHQVAKA